jgi:hypothetical protein
MLTYALACAWHMLRLGGSHLQRMPCYVFTRERMRLSLVVYVRLSENTRSIRAGKRVQALTYTHTTHPVVNNMRTLRNKSNGKGKRTQRTQAPLTYALPPVRFLASANGTAYCLMCDSPMRHNEGYDGMLTLAYISTIS